MEHIDMMEKLHEKAGISLGEAKEVLERADWDMLEALVILEREGKIQPLTTSVSTVENENAYRKVEDEIKKNQRKGKDSDFWDRAANNLKRLVQKCFTHSLVMRFRNPGNVQDISIPLFIVIILCCVNLTAVAVALLIGLVVGFNYYIEKNSDGISEE